MIKKETYDTMKSLIRLFGFEVSKDDKRVLCRRDGNEEILLDTNNTANGVVINSIQDYGTFTIALRDRYVKINEKHQDVTTIIESVNGELNIFASEVIDGKIHATRLIINSDFLSEQKSIYDGKNLVRASIISLSNNGNVRFSAERDEDEILIDKTDNCLCLGNQDDFLKINLTPVQSSRVLPTLLDDEIVADLNDSFDYLDSKFPGLRHILEQRYAISNRLYSCMEQNETSTVNTLLSGYKSKFKELKDGKDIVLSKGTYF